MRCDRRVARQKSRERFHAAPARLAEARRAGAGNVEERITRICTKPPRTETAAAEENVLFGLDNLHSYPCVQERLMDGSLRLHGWFFKIATAELFAYDPETRQFSPLVPEK